MTNIEIEFQALLCEQNGMLAENEYRSHLGQGVVYADPDFGKLADQIRALKTVEPETQETNNRSDEIAWLIDTISSANELMDEVNKVCLFEQAINNRIAKLRGLLKDQQSNEHEKS